MGYQIKYMELIKIFNINKKIKEFIKNIKKKNKETIFMKKI